MSDTKIDVKNIMKKNQTKVDIENATKSLVEDLEIYLESYKIQAKLHRLKYDCLIGEKFTETQALELSKTIFASQLGG